MHKKTIIVPIVLGTIAATRVHAQVAVTEFLNNPDGTDTGREWIELFNFGRLPVSLAGWTLRDHGSDAVALPGITVPSGGYLVIVSGGVGGLDAATAKAVFETEWLGGVPTPQVLGIEDMALANGYDEIELVDGSGEIVWSLAYADDEAPRFATFLTGTADFSVNVYGNRGSPGVVRWGYDNGVPGFLGYEQNDQTADELAYESDISQLEALYGEEFGNVRQPGLGSPLAGGYEVVPLGDADWDGLVGVTDLLAVLQGWGPCPPRPQPCHLDFDRSGDVAWGDVVIVLTEWG